VTSSAAFPLEAAHLDSRFRLQSHQRIEFQRSREMHDCMSYLLFNSIQFIFPDRIS